MASDVVSSFIDTYFLDPLRYPGQVAPYNVVNTATFALMALVAVFLIYKLLRTLKVEIDGSFVFAVMPWAVLGSVVHVLEDAGVLPRLVRVGGFETYPFVTPYIYFLIFFASILALLLAKKISKSNTEFNGRYQQFGIALVVLALLPLLTRVQYALHGLLILALALVGTGVVFLLTRQLFKSKANPKGRPLDKLELLLAFAQSFDGAATAVGVGIGTPTVHYVEQHVVGNAIFDFFGTPFAFYGVKLLFAALVIWAIRRELKTDKPDDARERAFLLMLLAIFGLAPGLRDALRLIVGV